MVVVMLSIPERDRVRSRTLEQLHAQGIFPCVTIQDNPARGGEVYHSYCKAMLKRALDKGSPSILFLEDDLDVGVGFSASVSVAMQADVDVTTFYCPGMQFYPTKIKRAIKTNTKYDSGLYRLVNRKHFFGSQALLLKSEFVLRLLGEWPQGCYLDTAIARVATEIFLYAPNPIQHYGACLKSTWSSYGKPHFSRSYIG